MNLLFDDSVDFRFQKQFADHHPEETVSNLQAMNWSASSEVMRELTALQKDRLLLTLALQTGFHVLVTSDPWFYGPQKSRLRVVVCDAGPYAPTLRFLNSLVPALDRWLKQLKEGENLGIERSFTVLRNATYDPSSSAPVAGSRLASSKLRPIEREKRNAINR